MNDLISRKALLEKLNALGIKDAEKLVAELPAASKECPVCRVHIGKPDFDPDDFIGEYEEENT